MANPARRWSTAARPACTTSDRTNGKPLGPIDERPVPQEPLQKTWPTQPFPEGDTLVPTCPTATGAGQPPPNFKSGCLFTPHLYQLVVQSPGTGGGADWSAISYDPRTQLIYTGAGIVNTAHTLADKGKFFRPLGEQRSGKIVAFNPATHKIVWQREMKWALAHGNGCSPLRATLCLLASRMVFSSASTLRMGTNCGGFKPVRAFTAAPSVMKSTENNTSPFLPAAVASRTTHREETICGHSNWADGLHRPRRPLRRR